MKLRPAVVLADVGRGDYILSQITSKPYADDGAVEIVDDAFATGSLRLTSYARPTKLFTANDDLIAVQVGRLKAAVFQNVVQKVIDTLTASVGSARAS